MRQGRILWLAWSLYTVAWFLPVHKDLISLPDGVPGWDAFRTALNPVWPYEGGVESWWAEILSVMSATTNLLMLVSPLVALTNHVRGIRSFRLLALAAVAVNTWWCLFLFQDLRLGYWLWWGSFLCMAVASFIPDTGPDRD